MKKNDNHGMSLRKQLLWRATHRGIREMDIIIGGFVTRNIDLLTQQQLKELEVLLDIPDQDYLAWVTKQEPVPPELRSNLLEDILSYQPESWQK